MLKDDPEGAVHHLAIRIVALAEETLDAIEAGERVFKPDEILTIVKIIVTASDIAKRNKPRKGNLGMLSIA